MKLEGLEGFQVVITKISRRYGDDAWLHFKHPDSRDAITCLLNILQILNLRVGSTLGAIPADV